MDGVGVTVGVSVGCAVDVDEGSGVGVAVATCVGVKSGVAGGVIVPSGVTLATGVSSMLTSVAYIPEALAGSPPRNTSSTMLKSSAEKSRPRGSAL